MSDKVTEVFISSNGTVCGIVSFHPFYMSALSANRLAVVVNFGNSVQFVHHDGTFNPAAPTADHCLTSERDRGFFNEDVVITKYTGTAATPARTAVVVDTPVVERTQPKAEISPAKVEAPKPAVIVTETAPDGGVLPQRRRGRPPGSKNKPKSEDLFDDAQFDSAAVSAAADKEEVIEREEETPAAPMVLEQDEELEPDDGIDCGDEDEDGEEDDSITAADIKSADARQLVQLASRLNVKTEPGMTAGVLRKALLSKIGG